MIILSFIANRYDQFFVLANQKRVILKFDVRSVAKCLDNLESSLICSIVLNSKNGVNCSKNVISILMLIHKYYTNVY